MKRLAFRMKLKVGAQEEYVRRHEQIWPELVDLLHEAGISDYTIWVDRQTNSLFALMHLADGNKADTLGDEPVMRKWWKHMADVVESGEDQIPIVVELDKVFHMP